MFRECRFLDVLKAASLWWGHYDWTFGSKNTSCPELLFAPSAFSFLSVLSSFFFPGWRQIFSFSQHILFIFKLPNAGIHSLGPKGVVGYLCGEGQHTFMYRSSCPWGVEAKALTVFFCVLPSYFLRQGLILNLKLIGQQVQGICLPLPTQFWYTPLCLDFM